MTMRVTGADRRRARRRGGRDVRQRRRGACDIGVDRQLCRAVGTLTGNAGNESRTTPGRLPSTRSRILDDVLVVHRSIWRWTADFFRVLTASTCAATRPRSSPLPKAAGIKASPRRQLGLCPTANSWFRSSIERLIPPGFPADRPTLERFPRHRRSSVRLEFVGHSSNH
jgi:hypothetical protein